MLNLTGTSALSFSNNYSKQSLSDRSQRRLSPINVYKSKLNLIRLNQDHIINNIRLSFVESKSLLLQRTAIRMLVEPGNIRNKGIIENNTLQVVGISEKKEGCPNNQDIKEKYRIKSMGRKKIKAPMNLPISSNKLNTTTSEKIFNEHGKPFQNKIANEDEKFINKNPPKKSESMKEIRKTIIFNKFKDDISETDEVEDSLQFTSKYFKQ